ncbi:GNAT family N-acetyltransferase [Yoonia vestfoldensis]|uniref:GNAT family N-acetyltransferase n=1 Tax=Yoonia vestfoldensis TaxID=245188 RepID=UPI0003817564|nr:GNAT family N-acetyltransferase [Yoonia vestfoldensis]
MTLPSAQRCYQVVEGTWPPAARRRVGAWTIRLDASNSSRVCSATAERPWTDDDITLAASTMQAAGQRPLFMIRAGEGALDDALAQRDYLVKDPVNIHAVALDRIATQRPPPVTTFEVWPPLAAQAEIWAAGGISAGRLAIMDRAPMPKTTILGRAKDRPAGTLFAGVHGDCAMVHAVEIATAFRRQGLARHMMVASAFWAQGQGARWMTLVATRANTAANALYASLGMEVVGQYHHRIMPEDSLDRPTDRP